MTRVPITSPLAVLTTRTAKEHLMTTHDTTDLKSGDIVQHPEKGPGIVYTSTPMRVMHRSAFGRLSSSNLAGWERVETVQPGHVQIKVDDLELHGWANTSPSDRWNDEEILSHRAAKAIAARRAESTPPAEEPEIVGDGCECWVTPEHMWTTYGSAIEPGSQVENNPRCPKHGEKPTSATVTLFCPDCGGAENVTVVMLGKQSNGERWFDLREFHAHTCPPAQPDEPTEFGARVSVCDMRLVSLMQNPTGGRLFADVKSGHIYDWDDLTERGTVTLGWDE